MKRFVLLLKIVSSFLVVSCATGNPIIDQIKRPRGSICLHFPDSEFFFCRDLITAEVAPDRKRSEANGWLIMPPETYQEINRYVQELRFALENGERLRINADHVRALEQSLSILPGGVEVKK